MISKYMIILLYILLYLYYEITHIYIFIDNFKNTSLDLKHWNYDLGDGCPRFFSFL